MKMIHPLVLAIPLCAVYSVGGSADAAELVLVQDGAPMAVIGIHAEASIIEREAADDLQTHLRMASGADVDIIETTDVGTLPADKVHLIVGAQLARDLGVDTEDLEPEEYVVRTVGNRIVFAGHDLGEGGGDASSTVRESAATVWAVGWFLDHQMGVRWLWPGETGTYVPARDTIVAPELDVREKPFLEQRKLRVQVHASPSTEGARLLTDAQRLQLVDETTQWKHRHQMGRRSTFKFGHAFGPWWEKYNAEFPDYFATAPEGRTVKKTNRAKLCVSNPAVAERIMEEWRAAGSPDNWNVCPNDGSGFCTCDNCRAMDIPADQAPEDVWSGKANLTARYVKFWNGLITAMREENPKATISSYAYSCYREPPEGLALNPGIVLGMVHTYHSFDEWKAWSDAGAQLFLRPNWWHMGGPAPHIPLHSQGEYFLFAREHSMIGYDFDSLIGSWGTQGPLYYLITRLSSRSDLTVDDVIEEYCSAFGAATPMLREYIAFWDEFADRATYAVPAGGAVSVDPNGLYEQTARKYEMNIHPIASSWPILPALYTDELLEEAEAILTRAETAATGDTPEVQARVKFVRDGLQHMRLTRDAIALFDRRFRPEGATENGFAEAAARLQDFRREITPRHVVWGETMNNYEIRHRFATGLVEAGWIETEGL